MGKHHESFAERLQKVSAAAKNKDDFSISMNQAICAELKAHNAEAGGLIETYKTIWSSNRFSKHFRGINLENADLARRLLANRNLTGANLRGANLAEVSLEGSQLTGADLRGANLAGAGLARANLSGADLTGAITVGTNFNDVLITQEQIASSIQTPAQLLARATTLAEANPAQMTATQKQDLPNVPFLHSAVRTLAQENDPQQLAQTAQVQLATKFPMLVQPGFASVFRKVMRETYRTVVEALKPGKRTNTLPFAADLLPTIMGLTQNDPYSPEIASRFTKALLNSGERVPSAGATMAEALKPFVTEGERPFVAGFVGKLEQERAKKGCTIC